MNYLILNKKHIIVFIVVILLLIFAVQIFSSIKIESNSESRKTINQKNFFNLIEKNKSKRLLNNDYFKGVSYDMFFSTNMQDTSIDLSFFYWTMKLINIVKADPLWNEKLKADVYPRLKAAIGTSNLDKLRMMTYINEKLGIEYNKIDIVKQAILNYDTISGLFFLKDKNEEISNKLSATNSVVELLASMNIEIPNKSDLVDKLITYYKDDNLFKKTYESESLLNNGGLVVQMLYDLGLSENEIKIQHLDLVNRIEWVQDWNHQITKGMNNDWLMIIALHTMYKIDSFYDISFDIDKDVIVKSFKQNTNFYQNGNKDTNFVKQPLIMYLMLEILQKNKIPYENMESLQDYLQDQIVTGFTKTSEPKDDLQENFYGLSLANSLGFEFNHEKVLVLLNKSYNSFLVESPNINNKNKLSSTYYLLESYLILNQTITNKKRITTAVNDFIYNLDLNNEDNIIGNASSLYYAIEILKICSGDVSKENKNKLRTFITFVNKSFNKEKNIDYNIVKLLDVISYIKYKNTEFEKNISSLIVNLKLSNAYKPKLGDGGFISLIATSEIISYLRTSGKLDIKEKERVLQYLKSETNTNINSKSQDNLRTLYETFRLQSLLD